ncbi:MAG: ABC transporter permease, partial [Thermomicrobiales bacterium]|nr:ABC transporter permease [Thermomicrobiales bacterium]
MQAFIIRRLIQAVFVLLGASIVSFALLHLAGNPVDLILPMDATAEERDAMMHQLGYDRPLIQQYADYMRGLVRGDFGESVRSRQPAMQLVLERLPATLELAAVAMAISIVFAFPAGIAAAIWRGSIVDRGLMVLTLIGQSVPVFFLGLVFILVFGVRLRWFPVAGRGGLEHLILPALSLGMYSMARTARLVRSGMLEVLQSDYITTARAKGLSEQLVVVRHALKNALVPIITILGLDIATLLGGAIITETIFSWPGLGQ